MPLQRTVFCASGSSQLRCDGGVKVPTIPGDLRHPVHRYFSLLRRRKHRPRLMALLAATTRTWRPPRAGPASRQLPFWVSRPCPGVYPEPRSRVRFDPAFPSAEVRIEGSPRRWCVAPPRPWSAAARRSRACPSELTICRVLSAQAAAVVRVPETFRGAPCRGGG